MEYFFIMTAIKKLLLYCYFFCAFFPTICALLGT